MPKIIFVLGGPGMVVDFFFNRILLDKFLRFMNNTKFFEFRFLVLNFIKSEVKLPKSRKKRQK